MTLLPQGYSLRLLGPEEYPAFAGMTYSNHRLVLLNPPEPIMPIAVGIDAAGIPVALGLATIDRKTRTAGLLSLFCQPSYRKLGLGAALLARLETEMICRNVPLFSCIWSSGVPGAGAVAHLFKKQGWSAPEPRMLLCTADAAIMKAPFFHAPIYSRIERALAGAEIFPWHELPEADRESIARRQLESPWIPADLHPSLHEEGLEPMTSVGVRIAGEVIGWMITHRLSDMVIRYTCSFIRRDYALKGGIIMLYREVIWRQYARLPEGTCGIWTVPLKHHDMAEFVRRRMSGYLKSFAVTQGSQKRLPP